MKTTIQLLFFAVICSFVACKSGSPPAEAVKEVPKATAVDLKNTTWLAIAMNKNGEETSFSKSYKLAFAEDKLNLSLDKNKCVGACRFSNEFVILSEYIACTEMCCDSKEAQDLSLLIKDSLVARLDGNLLLLESKGNTVRLKKFDTTVENSTPSNSVLYNNPWVVDRIVNKNTEKEHQLSQQNYVLKFLEYTVVYKLDVNKCRQKCRITPEYIDFLESSPSCTRACCDNALSKHLSEALTGKMAIKLEGKLLVLDSERYKVYFKAFIR